MFSLKKKLSEEEWKKKLTPEQYKILREKGTEPAFSGKLYSHKESGSYVCAGCRLELFSSDAKFDSGTGWPSFLDAVEEEAITLSHDSSHGLSRVEVKCGKCGGHLGHVFDDGPGPKGKRYCINSCALKFEKKEE